MIPREAVRTSQPQAVQPRPLREERLLGDDPRDARLRVVHRLIVRPERTVVIGTQCAGHEQAVFESNLLLHEGAERLRLGARGAGQRRRARADLGRPRRQVVRERAIAVENILEVLRSHGGPGLDGGAHLKRRGGIRVQRVIEEKRTVVGLVAGDRDDIDRRALVSPAQVGVHPARVIEPGDQATGQPTRRTPVELPAADKAVDVLVHGLREELVGCVEPVAVSPVVLETGPTKPVGQETGGVVVGLGQPLRAGHERGGDRGVEPGRQAGVHIGAQAGVLPRVGPILLVGDLIDLARRDELVIEHGRH